MVYNHHAASLGDSYKRKGVSSFVAVVMRMWLLCWFLLGSSSLSFATAVQLNHRANSLQQKADASLVGTVSVNQESVTTTTVTVYAKSVMDGAADASACSGTTSSGYSNDCNLRSALNYCLTSLDTTTYSYLHCDIVLSADSTSYVSQLGYEGDLLDAGSFSFSRSSASTIKYFSLSISSSSSTNQASVIGSSVGMRFLTLDSSNDFKPVNIVVSAFTLENITVSYFGDCYYDGGALYVNGPHGSTITLKNCEFTENQGYNGGAFYFGNTNNTVFDAVTCKYNYAEEDGGCLYLNQFNDNFDITGGSLISDNAASGSGGGIYLYQHNNHFTVTDSSTVSGNAASHYYGGGIYLYEYNNDFTISNNSSVSYNTASDGGGIYLNQYNNYFTISSNSFVHGNTAPYGGDGGGIYLYEYNNYFTITSYSSVSGNTAGYGGGIYLYQYNNDFTISSHSTVSGNNASYGVGGGIYLKQYNNYFTISSYSSVSANTAADGGIGGGIYLYEYNNYFTITSYSSVSGNIVPHGYGGGIYLLDNNNYFTISSHSTVSGNAATGGDGGGVYLSEYNNYFVIASNSSVSGNTASYGGGIYLHQYNDDFTISNNSSVHGNAASDGGGGMYLGQYNNYFTITSSSSVSGNTATDGNGGGVYLDQYNNYFTISKHSSVSGNTAPYGYGGGMYIYEYNDYFTLTSSSSVHGNTADSYYGGGMYLYQYNNDFTITSNSSVHGNAAAYGGAIYLYQHNNYFTISGSSYVYKNTATLGQGGGFYLSQFNNYFTIDGGSILSYNKARSSGGGIYMLNYNNYFRVSGGSSFSRNTAGLFGGGIYMNIANHCFSFLDSTATHNTASAAGGVLFVSERHGQFLVVNNTFSDNTAGDFGGVICFSSMNFQVNIMSCTFKNNIGGSMGGGALVLLSSNFELVVSDCIFSDNQGSAYAGAVLMVSVNHGVIFRSAVFVNNTITSGNGGALWFGLGNFDTTFEHSTFTKNHAFGDSASGGAAYFYEGNGLSSFQKLLGGGASFDTGSAFLPISFADCTFESNYATDSGGAIYSYSNNKIKAVGVTRFSNNSCGANGGAIALAGGSLFEFSRVNQFSNTDYKAIADFTDRYYVSYAAYFPYYNYYEVDASSDALDFYGNSAGASGGAIYVSSSSTCTFDESTDPVFRNNAAKTSSGGAIQLFSSSSMNVFSSHVTLIGNTAANGGISLDLGNGNSFTIVGSTINITRGDATVETAGVTYDSSYVYWIDNGNSSTVHLHYEETGANATKWECPVGAAYPYCLSTQSVRFKIVSSSGVDITEYEANSTGTGNMVRKFGLYDRFNQLNISDYSSTVTAAITGSNCSTQKGSFSGISSVTVNKGVASFSELSASCFPGGSADVTYTASLDGLPGTTYQLTYTETIHFRDCVNGEILKNFACLQCSDGTYSLSYDSSAIACTACPANSDSCYGNKIAVTAGYWRISASTTTFLSCPLGATACLGGYDAAGIDTSSSSSSSSSSSGSRRHLLTDTTSSSQHHSCADGYEGPLCAVCSSGYYLSGTMCMSCAGKSSNARLAITAYVIIPLIMLGVAALMVVYGKGSSLDINRLEEQLVKELKGDTEKEKKDGGGGGGADSDAADSDNGIIGFDMIGAAIQSRLSHIENPDVEQEQGFEARQSEYEDGREEGEEEEATASARADGAENTAMTNGNKVPLARRGYALVVGHGTKAWQKFKGKSIGSKVKILITAFQIVTALPSSVGISFPPGTTQLYHALSFVNFTSLEIGDPQCYAPRRLDYIDKLLIHTIAPIAVILLILIAGAVHVSYIIRHTPSSSPSSPSETSEGGVTRKQQIGDVVGRYLSMFFLVVYLVLPGVTTTIAGMIPTTNVDPDGIYPNENYYYMTNDLGTSVTSSRYKFGVIWAAVMLFVYPIGVPCLYFFVLYINCEKIKAKPRCNGDGGNLSLLAASQKTARSTKKDTWNKSFVDKIREYITHDAIYFLHGAYEGEFWYWELLETSRRLFLTALLSIVSAGSPAQIVFGIFLAMIYMKLYAYFQPYDRDEDDFLQELAQYQIFITFFIALLVQSDLCPGMWWAALFDAILIIASTVTVISSHIMAMGYYDRFVAVLPKRVEGPDTFITAKELFGRDPTNDPSKTVDHKNSTMQSDAQKLVELQQLLALTQSRNNAPHYLNRPPIDIIIEAIKRDIPYPDDSLDDNGASDIDDAHGTAAGEGGRIRHNISQWLRGGGGGGGGSNAGDRTHTGRAAVCAVRNSSERYYRNELHHPAANTVRSATYEHEGGVGANMGANIHYDATADQHPV